VRPKTVWNVPQAVACTATIDLGVIPNEADIDCWLKAFLTIQPAVRHSLELERTMDITVAERIERLEQLRALAAGLSIGVAVVENAEGGVDTYEDARRIEERLLALAR